MVNTQLFTCPKCAYKILQIVSRVFDFALAEFCAKFAKINAPRLLPRLQYFFSLDRFNIGRVDCIRMECAVHIRRGPRNAFPSTNLFILIYKDHWFVPLVLMDLFRMLSYPCYTIFPTHNMVFVRSGVSENEIC